MSDHSKLKALALEVPEGIVAPAAYDDDRSYSQSEVKLLNFLEVATPTAVLALIAENERLTHSRDEAREDRNKIGDRYDQLKAENEALRLFVSAACPVSTEINPRGYNWCEPYLDDALKEFRAAMGKGERPEIHHTSYALAHEPPPTCAACGVQMFTGLVPSKLCKGCQLD